MTSSSQPLHALTDILTHLTQYVANQTSSLAPITLNLPSIPVHSVATFISHITSHPVHPTYFPFLRFATIHAARVTTVWAGMIGGKDRRGVSVLQDLVGYLTMACKCPVLPLR